MKNLITDFEIFINENYSFNGISLAEKDNKKSDETLSGLSSATALIGSSVAKTTNKDAFSSLQEGFKEIDRSKINQELFPLIYTSFKDEKGNKVDSMNENQALIFKKGTCSIGPKTEKIKNYLKIDDVVFLNGDKGDLQVKDSKFGDIKKEGRVVEASGNGIFILGRLLKARATGSINDDTKVYLGMNYKKPIVLVANANTGFQAKGPGTKIITAMMSKNFFIPHKENYKALVIAAGNMSKDTEERKKSYFNRNATPSISMPITDKDDEKYLQKNLLPVLIEKAGDAASVASVSTDEVFKGFSPKSFKGLPDDYKIKELVEIYLEAQKRIEAPYFALIGERLKYFYNNIISEDFGAPSFVFADINKQIDSSIKGVIDQYKKSEDGVWAKKEITGYFSPAVQKSGDTNRGAKASVEVSKQSEGGI